VDRVTIGLLRWIGVGLMALLAGCSGVDVQVGVYQTLEEARAAGAIDNGWVPQGLPASAADLREGHLDDGRRWGTFSFDASHRAPLEALLGSEITSGVLSCDAPGRLEWWPRVLRSPIDPTHVASTGFRLYPSRDGALTFAVNWNQGRAYYWRG
jgi:hypothetical protein